MEPVNEAWRLNLPQFLTLPDFSLDDADTDRHGNVYVCDSLNACVYKFSPDSIPMGVYELDHPKGDTGNTFPMSIAVDEDSNFFVSDSRNGRVLKYDSLGRPISEYLTPGVVAICYAGQGAIYTLSTAAGLERIERYDRRGNLQDVLPCPPRSRGQSDPCLLRLDTDAYGNIYMSQGMPPYQISRIRADGSRTDTLRRDIEFPNDAVLIADIAVDRATGNLFALLSCKTAGLQLVDCFHPDGQFAGVLGLPHHESLYSVLSISPDSSVYALNTGNGPGAGDLLRASR